MKAKALIVIDNGYRECSPNEATHILVMLPGPLPNRIIPVITKGSRHGKPCWTWNGSLESPDLKPSVRSRAGNILCHSWINNGKVQFLSDCTHEFAGQTLDLLDIE